MRGIAARFTGQRLSVYAADAHGGRVRAEKPNGGEPLPQADMHRLTGGGQNACGGGVALNPHESPNALFADIGKTAISGGETGSEIVTGARGTTAPLCG